MRLFFLIFQFSIFNFSIVFAQRSTQFSETNQENKLSINGKVVDEQGEPVPYAAVALYSTTDSSLLGGTASDGDGKFSVEANSGKYFLKITFLSFEEKIVPGITLDSERKNLGNIVLKPSALALNEVTVKAEKSEMQIHLDKRVFNVGKDIANTGSNAIEILDNVPSVSVDIDGNVSLRGSENVRILIDGKPSGLRGTDALRHIPGNLIESIEVITNPSARYDAEGEVGIINIILKKEVREGVNGSFEVTVGYPQNYGTSVSVNYRKNKFNLFASYGLNYRKSPGKGFSLQEFTEADTSYSYEVDRKTNRGGLSNNLRVGSDIFLNKANTLTLSGGYRYSMGMNDARLIYKDFDENKVLTKTTTRKEDEEENAQDIEADISYRKTFSKKGQEFTANAKWVRSDDHELADIVETNSLDSLSLNQRSSNREDEQNWLVKTDYVHPFLKEGKFETGFKATLRDIENDYTVEELAPGNEWQILPDYDNHFIYRENIYAAYVIAGNKTKNFSYQAGLRVELSDIGTELVASLQKNRRLYIDFFPSAHLAYEFKKSNTLQLSYSRRLSRPGFRHLLPFYSYGDNRNIRTGNPDLDPEYTHSIELGHLKYFEKGSLLYSVYYRHTTGVIERVTTTDTSLIVRTVPVNLSKENSYGVEVSTSYNPFPWWKLTGNVNFSYASTLGEYEGKKLSSASYRWIGKISSKATIAKKVNFQTAFSYNAPQNTTQGKQKSRYWWDAGLGMDVLKGNGTVTLSGKDLLNTNKRRSVTESEGFYSESEFQWRSRQVLLSFSYRLNQKKKPERSNEGNFDGGEDGF